MKCEQCGHEPAPKQWPPFATPIFSWPGVTYSFRGPIFMNMNASGSVYLGGKYCDSRESADSDKLESTVYRIVVRPKFDLLTVKVPKR